MRVAEDAMPRTVTPLNDTRIRRAKSDAKPLRLSDGDGLHILVQPSGAKWWRMDYVLAGRRNTLSVGVYPDVSLAQARERRQEVRAQVAVGIDPSVARQQARAERTEARTFGEVAQEWLAKQHLAEGTRKTATWQIETLIKPWLGHRPIGEIEPPELLAVLRRIESRGRVHTAHRVLQRCSQVFRYAVATGRAHRDPAADLRGALAPDRATHRAAVTTPNAVRDLLRALDVFEGSFVVASALKLAPLTFVRPGELRRAEWAEFDLDAAEWRIPASKMKMREPHVVPLSRQAVEVLRELQPLTGSGRFVFPSIRTSARTMSENTINVALRRLGYASDEMCGHGFRSTASTMLNELGWPSDVIERQLAHAPKNQVRATYNRAMHLDDRRRMMQAWADHLDALKAGAQVVPIGALAHGR